MNKEKKENITIPVNPLIDKNAYEDVERIRNELDCKLFGTQLCPCDSKTDDCEVCLASIGL